MLVHGKLYEKVDEKVDEKVQHGSLPPISPQGADTLPRLPNFTNDATTTTPPIQFQNARERYRIVVLEALSLFMCLIY